MEIDEPSSASPTAEPEGILCFSRVQEMAAVYSNLIMHNLNLDLQEKSPFLLPSKQVEFENAIAAVIRQFTQTPDATASSGENKNTAPNRELITMIHGLSRKVDSLSAKSSQESSEIKTSLGVISECVDYSAAVLQRFYEENPNGPVNDNVRYAPAAAAATGKMSYNNHVDYRSPEMSHSSVFEGRRTTPRTKRASKAQNQTESSQKRAREQCLADREAVQNMISNGEAIVVENLGSDKVYWKYFKKITLLDGKTTGWAVCDFEHEPIFCKFGMNQGTNALRRHVRINHGVNLDGESSQVKDEVAPVEAPIETVEEV